MNQLTKVGGLTAIPLMLLMTGAIDSIRNLPATALFGSSLLFFFTLSAIFFLIPSALIAAELSASACHKKNGIYHWVSSALGNKWGVLAVWLQWINTMVWFPTILSFIAGTSTYLIDPSLAQNKIYLVSIILSLFWLVTFINLKGFQTSAAFANFCTSTGMIIPMIQIIGLAIAWVILRKPLQIHFTFDTVFPSLNHADNWISLTAIMASFLGIELTAVHIKDVHQPQKTFPKALALSVLLILTTMIMGSLAIALVLPKEKINLVAGVMQAFTNFFAAYHLSWFLPVIAIMLLLGSVGNMVTWVISPAKSLLLTAQDGYLPKFFIKENQHGVSHRLLITQAIFVSCICLVFLLMPSVNASYWFLTALSTQLYIMMYVLMFIAAFCSKVIKPSSSKNIVIPCGKIGVSIICALGLIACLTTLVIGFIPPAGVNVGSTFHYQFSFGIGLIAMLFPVLILYFYKSYIFNVTGRDLFLMKSYSNPMPNKIGD
jgi:amino acid transporter